MTSAAFSMTVKENEEPKIFKLNKSVQVNHVRGSATIITKDLSVTIKNWKLCGDEYGKFARLGPEGCEAILNNKKILKVLLTISSVTENAAK